MTRLPIEPIARQDAPTQAVLLALNNANAESTSLLTPETWRALIEGAFAADCIGDAALLIAFDQEADYASPNFLWFHDRLARFVYVDRIVVARSQRGRGLASRLYRELFRKVQAAAQDRVVCEVNLVPPNPVSDAFHARMGFAEIGRATLGTGGKTVRYLAKQLTPVAP